jgi:hypothetical protein
MLRPGLLEDGAWCSVGTGSRSSIEEYCNLLGKVVIIVC